MKVKSLIIGALLCGFCSLGATEVITVGSTPIPHSEILKFIKPILAKKGYDLKIKVFTDFLIPNKALENGDLDANYFQHIPFLEEFNKRNGTHIVKTVKVHIEPMGAYSKKIKSLSELKDGDKIGIPNDPTNEARALKVLQEGGLIKLNNNPLATPRDIIQNPKHLKFIEIEAAQVPRTLKDTAISVINTNFALLSGLNPLKDAIILENKNSPYVNVVAVKQGHENDPKIKALDEAINSPQTREYIKETFKGAVIPVF